MFIWTNDSWLGHTERQNVHNRDYNWDIASARAIFQIVHASQTMIVLVDVLLASSEPVIGRLRIIFKPTDKKIDIGSAHIGDLHQDLMISPISNSTCSKVTIERSLYKLLSPSSKYLGLPATFSVRNSTIPMAETYAPEKLVATLLSITESSIIPLTRSQVSSGNKLFGAAILSKSAIEPITIATNNESASPLLHGEINCIQTFFASPADTRPKTKDCIFFATHEPCSLCLSGITWSGFNEFYYLFTYEDSRDLFAIPYDIDILQSVFQVASPGDSPETLAAKPLYNRQNKFFTARSIADVVATIDDEAERVRLEGEVARVKTMYNELSDTYQKGKARGQETSSFFK